MLSFGWRLTERTFVVIVGCCVSGSGNGLGRRELESMAESMAGAFLFSSWNEAKLET